MKRKIKNNTLGGSDELGKNYFNIDYWATYLY